MAGARDATKMKREHRMPMSKNRNLTITLRQALSDHSVPEGSSPLRGVGAPVRPPPVRRTGGLRTGGRGSVAPGRILPGLHHPSELPDFRLITTRKKTTATPVVSP